MSLHRFLLHFRETRVYKSIILSTGNRIYNANIDKDKCKTVAKLIEIFCNSGTTLYLLSLFLLNLNQSKRSKKLENHIKLTLIFPFFLVLRYKHISWITFLRYATTLCQVFNHGYCIFFQTCISQSNIISKYIYIDICVHANNLILFLSHKISLNYAYQFGDASEVYLPLISRQRRVYGHYNELI